jgi:hypothetical protein
MSFTFEMDKTVGVIVETWTGRVDVDQLKQSCVQEWAHPDYKRRMPLISDFRQAVNAISAPELWQFALWFGNKDAPVRHAVVVGREAGFGFAQMFALSADAAKQEQNATRVFSSFDEAFKWASGT